MISTVKLFHTFFVLMVVLCPFFLPSLSLSEYHSLSHTQNTPTTNTPPHTSIFLPTPLPHTQLITASFWTTRAAATLLLTQRVEYLNYAYFIFFFLPPFVHRSLSRFRQTKQSATKPSFHPCTNLCASANSFSTLSRIQRLASVPRQDHLH